MDKPQNSPQPQLQSHPIQISHEHLQQLQQLQIQHALGSIQVKQEYQNQQGLSEIKPQILEVNSHQQLQAMQMIDSQSAHQSSNNIMAPQTTSGMNTISPLQTIQANQIPSDWQQNRLQVIPQTIQNFPLQQLYATTTGQPVMMSGNILGGQQQIQLITAGKPFPGSTLSAQQMLASTAPNKQVLGTTNQNYGSTYTLSSGNQSQALVLSPFISSQQQSQQQQQSHQQPQQGILASNSCNQTGNRQVNQNDPSTKQIIAQKVYQKPNTVATSTPNVQSSNISSSGQCIQVTQTQIPTAQIVNPIQQTGTPAAMQFGSWLQGNVPFWTTNSLQPSTLLAPNSIVIRGTNPDGTHGMFIQQASQLTSQQLTPHQQNCK